MDKIIVINRTDVGQDLWSQYCLQAGISKDAIEGSTVLTLIVSATGVNFTA